MGETDWGGNWVLFWWALNLMLSKSLIQFSVEGQGCVPWGQTMVEVMKIMTTSFQRSHAGTTTLSAPNPAAGHRQFMPLPETPGHSWASLGQSLVGFTAPFSWVLVCTRFCLCPPRVCFPALWWVNGKLLQEGLCCTQVYHTQSPKTEQTKTVAD